MISASAAKSIVMTWRATRAHPHVQLGASPRGGIHLLLLSKVLAVLDGRDQAIRIQGAVSRLVVPAKFHADVDALV